tara:strand:+ start:451 stop:999 length:549 start_codon:yes stop_codon:yes gene_type:complete
MANLSNMQYGQDGNPELEDIKRAYDQIDDNGTPLRRNISTQENALMTDIDTVEKQQNKAVAANERAQAEAARSRGRYGVQLTGAEQNELTKIGSLTGASTVSGAMNLARRSDDEVNLANTVAMTQLLQGGVKSALAQLQSFRDIGVARENSYTKARAGAKRSYYGFLGNIAGTVGKVIGAGG